MGDSQSGQDASGFRALGNGVSGAGAGQGSAAGDRELHNRSGAPQAAGVAYPNGGRSSLVSEFGLYDTSSSNQHFGLSHGGYVYDEQSLALAFEAMSFNSRATDVPASHRNVPLANGHYPSGRVDGTLNQLPHLGVQDAMRNSGVERQGQSYRFAPQLGNFPRTSDLHSFDSNLGVPGHPSAAAASPFQQIWQSQMYAPHQQNVGSNFMWQQNAGVQPNSIVQPNHVYPQVLQVSGFDASRHRTNEQAAFCPPAKGPSSSYIGTPNFHWLENGSYYLNSASHQKRRISTFTDSFPSTSYTGRSCGSGDFRHFQRAEMAFNPYRLHHPKADNLAHPHGFGFSHHQIFDKLNNSKLPGKDPDEA